MAEKPTQKNLDPTRARIAELAALSPDATLKKMRDILDQGAEGAERRILEMMGHQEVPPEQIALAAEVGRKLVKRGEYFSIAESCTTGSVMNLMAGISGASKFFVEGGVMYGHKPKNDIPDIDEKSMIEYGSVREYVATEMAKYIKKKNNTAWGIGISGIAPSDGEGKVKKEGEKQPGLVYITIVGPNGEVPREFKFVSAKTRAQYKTLVGAVVLIMMNEQLDAI